MDPDLGPPAEEAAAPMLPDAPEVFSSEREAARALTAARRAAQNPPPAESAPKEAAPAEEPELAEANDPPETDPVETEAAEPEEKVPPIERPRSWAKELDEEWSSYPREAQERIAKREQERDIAIRRSQNEAAEARKAAQAEREAAEQARKQYEAQLPNLMQELQSVTQSNFADIRTMDDVVKLQAEDPFRFQAWQVHQMRLQAVKAQDDQAKALKTQEQQTRRSSYENEQNKLLVELVPEMADSKKASEMRERAISMLTDELGLKNETLSRWMNDDIGHEILSNAGIQKIIADRLKYLDIQNAPKAVAAKTLPPVTRPGTAPTTRTSNAAKIQAITKQLDNETGLQAIRLSAELLRLKRAG